MAVTACGSSSESSGGDSSSEPFKVYALATLTGPAASAGSLIKASLELAVADVNKAGGIDGRQVELEVVDSGGDPTKAVSLLQGELAKDKPDLVYAANTSTETLALCAPLAQNKVLSISGSGSSELNDQELCPDHFSVVSLPATYSASQAALLTEKGVTSAGAILPNDALGTAIEPAMKAEYPKAGIEITGIEHFNDDAIRMTTQLDNLRKQDPGVMLMDASASVGAGHILESRRELRWDVPVIAGIGVSIGNVESQLPADAVEGVDMFTYKIATNEGASAPKVQDFLRRLKTKLGGKLTNSLNVYTYHYDILWVAKAAAERAKSTDGDEMAAALETFAATPPESPGWITYENYAYTPTNHFVDPGPDAFALAEPGLSDDGTRQSAAQR